MEKFGKFITIVLIMIISSIVNGFVILKLWTWFIVPIFEIQPLRLIEAIGLMFLVNYLMIKQYKKTEKEEFWEKFISNLVFLIFYSAFTLFAGWLVNLFM